MRRSADPVPYYVASTPPVEALPALAGTLDCDVCVVGGGIAGCTTALRLAQGGYRVVLLERETVGAGASGRNGGQALPGVACGQGKLQALIGPADARRVWDITVEGIRDLRQLVDSARIECDWVSGHLLTAIKRRHDQDLAAELELLQSYGYRSASLLAPAKTRDVLATERYRCALYDSFSGHLNPLPYVRGIARAARARGVQIYEDTPMTAYSGAQTVRVSTPAGAVTCRHLILCGNASLAAAMPALKRKILGISTSLVATQVLGRERAEGLIRNNAAVADMNWVLDYFRRTADHRLLFGGRIKYSAAGAVERPDLARQRMLRVFPQLADVAIEHAWSGTIDISLNRAPHFGRLQPNVYFLQGFSGHGVVLAGIAGRLIAEAVAGTAERFDVFARIPHRDFPGGDLLRRPALVLAMLYFRLRDAL